jgi:uncharacterized membrane protein
MRFRLRTLLIVLALGPLLAFTYFSPRLASAFVALLACAAFADWLARRMSPQPPK